MATPTPDHIHIDRLTDLAEGRLTPDEHVPLLAHLAGCPACARELEQLQRLLMLMRTDTTEDAPPAVVARAVALFQPRSASLATLGDRVRRLVAALRFDSGLTPLALGVRSGGSAARQWLFETDGYTLDVRALPSGEHWSIVGQVLGACSGGQVTLSGPAGTTQVALTGLCEFTVPPQPAGVYALHLRLNVEDVEIEGITLTLG
jgi:anti-sigma factor RsiW